jgi:hypothetical protein
MPNAKFQDYVQRGLVDLDIASFENFYTGTRPTITPSVFANDGAIDPKHRFAGDDMPGVARIMALSKLPAGFGGYANGLIIMYCTTGITNNGQVTGQIGKIGSTVVSSGNWSYMSKNNCNYRVAVHRPASSPYEYATGWVEVEGIGQDLATPSWGENPYAVSYNGLPADAYWGHRSTGVSGHAEFNADYRRNISHSTFICQTMGDVVLLFATTEGNAIQSGNSKTYPLYQINPDLTHRVLRPLGFSVNGYSMNATSFFISEDVDPTIWISAYHGVASFPLSSTDPDALIAAPEEMGGYSGVYPSGNWVAGQGYGGGASATATGHIGLTFQVVGPDVTNMNGSNLVKEYDGCYDYGHCQQTFVHPWSAGTYGPPEIWTFVPDSLSRSFTIYRSRYRAGQYRRPNEGVGTPLPGHAYKEFYGDILSGVQYPFFLYGIGLDAQFASNTFAFTDDPDYHYGSSAGPNQYPKVNPKGYGFEWDWMKPSNIVGHVPSLPKARAVIVDSTTLVRNAHDAGVHEIPVPMFRSSTDFKVWRSSTPGTLHMVITEKGSWYNALLTTDPYETDKIKDWSNTTQFWTGTSIDDGATWTIARPQVPARGRHDSVGAYTRKGYMQLGDDFSDGIAQTFNPIIAIDNAGRAIVGCQDYWQYFKPDGSRVPFWNRNVSDGGCHYALWFIGDLVDTGSGAAGPSTVLFSRSKPVT